MGGKSALSLFLLILHLPDESYKLGSRRIGLLLQLTYAISTDTYHHPLAALAAVHTNALLGHGALVSTGVQQQAQSPNVVRNQY
ncbi:hypothetical protein NPIL_192361 [Nephila pilipes]|uniref:Secreted protein n=1 Tax=Nephila pilipes TaxID=299642 RepID=A0A8X6P5R3_NEPPI|nr:hypothetical protein NPIL_192361 [Nephila pilipes]